MGYPSNEHNHGEAFMLMNYESEDGTLKEVVWNSRDGITPFSIHDKSEKVLLRHVRWNDDKYAPNHKPLTGERYFVDATEELVSDKLKSYIDDFWDAGGWKTFGSKEAAYDQLLPRWIENGSPWIMEA